MLNTPYTRKYTMATKNSKKKINISSGAASESATRHVTPRHAICLMVMGLAVPLAAALVLAWAPQVTCATSSSHVTPRCVANSNCSSSHISVSHSAERKTVEKKKMADCSAQFRTDFLRVLQSRRRICKDFFSFSISLL